MVDQLIKDACSKVEEFEQAWKQRAEEFKKAGDYVNQKAAELLVQQAKRARKKMDGLLEEDKLLDKEYELLKARKRLGLAYA